MAADGQGLRGGEQEDVPTRLTPPAAETGGEGQQGEDSKPGIGKRPRLLLVGLFFALMGVGVGVNSYHGISYVRTAGDPGWLPGLDGRVRTYGGVSGADLSGVRDGDQVAALDGQGFESSRQYFETFARHAPGAAYTMTVRRGGRDEQLTLRTAPYHPWVQIIAVLLLLILPATFLLTGLGIFLLKPDHKQALLLALMLGMAVLGGYPPFALPFAGLPRWLAAVMTAGLIVGAAGALPVMLNFFLVFPERSPLLVRFPRLEIYLYPFFLLTAAPFLVVAALQVAPAPGRILVVLQEFRGLLALSFAVGTGYLLGALLSLVANYRRGNQVSRRKLRLILVATVAAFMPSYLLRTLILSGLRPSPGPLSLALITVVLMALMLFPLSFAYAIMRHQVIPVSLLVRRSV
ncbi:MAG TPA: hypothetical protein VFC61_09255, partial [Blastocatellia bacterium]|nr:hypothetical protein [Blastocatellia bacterium]